MNDELHFGASGAPDLPICLTTHLRPPVVAQNPRHGGCSQEGMMATEMDAAKQALHARWWPPSLGCLCRSPHPLISSTMTMDDGGRHVPAAAVSFKCPARKLKHLYVPCVPHPYPHAPAGSSCSVGPSPALPSPISTGRWPMPPAFSTSVPSVLAAPNKPIPSSL